MRTTRKSMLKLEVPGIEEKDLDVQRREQHSHRQGRAQVRVRGEGRELPSHRAALRQLLSRLHTPVHRGYGACAGQVQCRRAQAGTFEEARSPAQADQDQRRRVRAAPASALSCSLLAASFSEARAGMSDIRRPGSESLCTLRRLFFASNDERQNLSNGAATRLPAEQAGS